MATKKQIAANRKNARKSRGPRTISGKITARMNSLRHGVLSIMPSTMFEDEQDAESILLRVRAEYKPEGFLEKEQVYRLANLLLKQRMLFSAEAGQRETEQAELLRSIKFEETGQDPELKDLTEDDKTDASILHPMLSIDETLKFGRYQTMLQNQTERTVRELDIVQAKRLKALVSVDGSNCD